MKTVAAKLYEGMFLVDSALAASDWQGVCDSIRSILKRVEAQIISVDKWDERKLAYDIRGKSRGTYILAYFRVDGPKVAEIERLAQLNENIVRVLILSVEELGEEYVTQQTAPAAGQEQSRPQPAAEQESKSIGEQTVDDKQDSGEGDDNPDLAETDVPDESEEK